MKKQLSIVFYKANKGNWIDWIVNICSGFDGYSHCEILFSDGLCFSASPREGSCRFKKIDGVETDGKWVIRPLVGYEYDEADIRKRSEEQVGKHYDWVGIFFHQFLQFNIDAKNKWWCSEICGYLIKLDEFKISPNKLAKVLGV